MDLILKPSCGGCGSAPPSGSVTEDETRAVLLQRTPVRTGDFVDEFISRLKLEEIEDDISPVFAPNKEAPKEEPVDNSNPPKPTASGAGRVTPSTSKSSKGEGQSNDVKLKTTDGAPLNALNAENELKYGKDETASSAENNPRTKTGSAPPSGRVTEDEVRALLQRRKRMTLRDFTRTFYPRVKTKRDEDAFAAIVKRITRQQKNGASVSENLVFLREIEDDISPVVAPKEEVPRKEPVDNSSSPKSSASGADRGTPSTANSSKGKIINNGEESETTNEVKSVKDEPASSTKCNAPTKCASPPASSKSKSAPSAGPITEDEIRALLQETPMTIGDFALAFGSRLKTKRAAEEFVATVARITKKRKTDGADSEYVLFLQEETC